MQFTIDIRNGIMAMNQNNLAKILYSFDEKQSLQVKKEGGSEPQGSQHIGKLKKMLSKKDLILISDKHNSYQHITIPLLRSLR